MTFALTLSAILSSGNNDWETTIKLSYKQRPENIAKHKFKNVLLLFFRKKNRGKVCGKLVIIFNLQIAVKKKNGTGNLKTDIMTVTGCNYMSFPTLMSQALASLIYENIWTCMLSF